MPNPYVDGMADGITRRATQNLQQNILPGIGSGANMAGGYGGSRQGVAEGQAIGQTNQGITDSLAGLYSNAYNTDQANNTSRLGIGANYSLGLQQSNNNFYTQNRQLDQSGAQLGANLYSQGIQGALSQGAGQYAIGTQQQQAPWQTLGNASNVFSQYSGLGGSQVNTQNGSRLGGIVGGALAGSQIFNNLGLGRSTPSNNSPYTAPGTVDPNYYGSDYPGYD